MLVFALSALPVYFLYNMDATCHTIDVLTETPASINQLCVDARQFGNGPSMNGNTRDLFVLCQGDEYYIFIAVNKPQRPNHE